MSKVTCPIFSPSVVFTFGFVVESIKELGGASTSHDAVWDVFASIVKDVRVHVLRLQTHVLSLPFFSIFSLAS